MYLLEGNILFRLLFSLPRPCAFIFRCDDDDAVRSNLPPKWPIHQRTNLTSNPPLCNEYLIDTIILLEMGEERDAKL